MWKSTVQWIEFQQSFSLYLTMNFSVSASHRATFFWLEFNIDINESPYKKSANWGISNSHSGKDEGFKHFKMECFCPFHFKLLVCCWRGGAHGPDSCSEAWNYASSNFFHFPTVCILLLFMASKGCKIDRLHCTMWLVRKFWVPWMPTWW